MGEGTTPLSEGLTRRRLLAGSATVAAGAVGVAGGCLSPIEDFLGGPKPEQVSLQIKTLPADFDSTATRIGRELAKRLEKVGVKTEIVLLPPEQLKRDVLLNQNFDVYVGTMEIPEDPDFLRPLFHSQYSENPGWLNPFGFTDVELDKLLENQRHQTGTFRRNTIKEAQEIVAREQPFVPLVTNKSITALGTDRFVGWDRFHARSPMWLIGLERSTDEDAVSGSNASLTMAITDPRPTETSNPLRATFDRTDIATEMLYDPLARYYDGGLRPWLAESWDWDAGGQKEVSVRLRSDLTWHDGKPLTPKDVKFTYTFLSDTAFDKPDSFAPAPGQWARTDLVESVDIVTDRMLKFTIDAARPVAERAFTVPLLPRHVWKSKTKVVSSDPLRTEALSWENPSPIGSGPMAFDARAKKESMRLVRYDEHPLNRDEDSQLTRRFGGLAISDLKLLVAPSDVTAVNHVDVGTADITGPTLGSDTVDRIEGIDDVTSLIGPSRSIYHIGFNVREAPLRNPNFRRATARLLDKGKLAETVFHGYAEPLATPILDEEWVPSGLQWRGNDPQVPFTGTNGTIDEPAAREYFRDAGFRYTDDGRLVH